MYYTNKYNKQHHRKVLLIYFTTSVNRVLTVVGKGHSLYTSFIIKEQTYNDINPSEKAAEFSQHN